MIVDDQRKAYQSIRKESASTKQALLTNARGGRDGRGGAGNEGGGVEVGSEGHRLCSSDRQGKYVMT